MFKKFNFYLYDNKNLIINVFFVIICECFPTFNKFVDTSAIKMFAF